MMRAPTFMMAAAVFVLTGCSNVSKSRQLVPPPPKPVDNQSVRQLTERSPGVLGRTVFTTPTGEAFRAQFEDLIVGPATAPVAVPVPQGAVVEVRSGEGVAGIGSRSVEFKQGATFAVGVGEPLTIQARGGPVQLRVVLVSIP